VTINTEFIIHAFSVFDGRILDPMIASMQHQNRMRLGILAAPKSRQTSNDLLWDWRCQPRCDICLERIGPGSCRESSFSDEIFLRVFGARTAERWPRLKGPGRANPCPMAQQCVKKLSHAALNPRPPRAFPWHSHSAALLNPGHRTPAVIRSTREGARLLDGEGQPDEEEQVGQRG
jgi:hypothetical protein